MTSPMPITPVLSSDPDVEVVICGYRWLDPFGEENWCGLAPSHRGNHLATWAVS